MSMVSTEETSAARFPGPWSKRGDGRKKAAYDARAQARGSTPPQEDPRRADVARMKSRVWDYRNSRRPQTEAGGLQEEVAALIENAAVLMKVLRSSWESLPPETRVALITALSITLLMLSACTPVNAGTESPSGPLYRGTEVPVVQPTFIATLPPDKGGIPPEVHATVLPKTTDTPEVGRASGQESVFEGINFARGPLAIRQDQVRDVFPGLTLIGKVNNEQPMQQFILPTNNAYEGSATDPNVLQEYFKFDKEGKGTWVDETGKSHTVKLVSPYLYQLDDGRVFVAALPASWGFMVTLKDSKGNDFVAGMGGKNGAHSALVPMFDSLGNWAARFGYTGNPSNVVGVEMEKSLTGRGYSGRIKFTLSDGSWFYPIIGSGRAEKIPPTAVAGEQAEYIKNETETIYCPDDGCMNGELTTNPEFEDENYNFDLEGLYLNSRDYLAEEIGVKNYKEFVNYLKSNGYQSPGIFIFRASGQHITRVLVGGKDQPVWLGNFAKEVWDNATFHKKSGTIDQSQFYQLNGKPDEIGWSVKGGWISRWNVEKKYFELSTVVAEVMPAPTLGFPRAGKKVEEWQVKYLNSYFRAISLLGHLIPVGNEYITENAKLLKGVARPVEKTKVGESYTEIYGADFLGGWIRRGELKIDIGDTLIIK